jgi:hypothetical protein
MLSQKSIAVTAACSNFISLLNFSTNYIFPFVLELYLKENAANLSVNGITNSRHKRLSHLYIMEEEIGTIFYFININFFTCDWLLLVNRTKYIPLVNPDALNSLSYKYPALAFPSKSVAIS